MSKSITGIKDGLGSKSSIHVLDLSKQSSRLCLRQLSLTNGSQQLSGVQNVAESMMSVLMKGCMSVNVDIKKIETSTQHRTCLQSKILSFNLKNFYRRNIGKLRSWSSRPLLASRTGLPASLNAEVRRCSVFS